MVVPFNDAEYFLMILQVDHLVFPLQRRVMGLKERKFTYLWPSKIFVH